MSNFNEFFRTKGAKTIVDKLFDPSKICKFSKYEMTELKWHVEDDSDKPASYYIENGLTATHKVILEYTVNYDGVVRYSEFEVPREIDGAFIIGGAYRIATNTLGNDYLCRINMSGTGRHYINFDREREYDIPKGLLRIKKTDPILGLPEKVREYKLDDLDNISGLEREALRLTDRQRKKLQVKLDLSYDPEFITSKLIKDCVAFGDDRIKDLIIDKEVESVPKGFINYIFYGSNRKNFWGTQAKIRNYWTKNGYLQDQVNVLTMMCARYWKGSSDASKGGSDLQISPGINAINLQSITSKIQVPSSVAYNTSFSDIICIGATPINQNVGKQNALTISTHITDDDVLFDVYDKDFKKITIPYIDYLNSKVCSSKYVDYENNTILPDADGNVVVKYRMKRKTVKASEIDLVDLHPDYRLSEEVRRIPFVNYTDSIRVHMGQSMLKQSIPLVNAERPLVDTGNYAELSNNVLNEKFTEESGVVKEITEKEIIIEDSKGSDIRIPRRSAIQSVNDVDVFLEPKVKVGQKVVRGDIITGAVNLEKDTYKSGINALVLFHAMFGLVNEDALVVSESFSKQMRSYTFIDLSYDVKTTEAVKWIAPIGMKVQSRDSVLTVNKAVRLDAINQALQNKLGGFLGDLSEYTVEANQRVPNNIAEAYVSDVLIQENTNPVKSTKSTKSPDLAFSKTSEPIIKAYVDGKKEARKEIYAKYPEYVAADTLNPIVANKTDKVAYTIRIRLVKVENLIVGSKVTNRYGGKGVISKVLPDDQMPVMVEEGTGKKKVVQVVMNPYSTINRKIPSVNMEQLLGNCIVKIHDLVEEWKDDDKKKEKILPFLEKYYPGRFTGLTIEEFIKKHNNTKLEDMYYINVGSFSTKFTPELIDEWANELGVKPQSKILIPTNTIADLDELKESLPEDEYVEAIKNMSGRYTEIDKPLSVGYMTLINLYHKPDYSEKTTSSMFGVDVNEFKDQPILGRGRYRTTGQKIGEMEMASLLARGASDFLQEARGDTAREDSQRFLNNLLGLGLTVTDKKGYNQGGSQLKDRINDMKVKFRLKNSK